MSQAELLRLAVDRLDELGIPSMLTGSLASSLHGAPRATHDIDLVVDLQPTQIGGLIAAFPAPQFYLSHSAVEAAVREQSMFNLLAIDEGDKIDFWMLTDQPFDQRRFARRQRMEIGGANIAVSTPEDTILMKLCWARDSGGSERQLSDIRGICDLQAATLDRGYLDSWLDPLGVREVWRAALRGSEGG
jgi:hypothetical protein